MSDFADKLHEWEIDIAVELYRIVEPDEDGQEAIEADEVCFFGSVLALPDFLSSYRGLASPSQPPEVYAVALKNGEPLPPEIWLAEPLASRVEASGLRLQQKMEELVELYLSVRQEYPSVVKTAVVVETGQAVTIQEFGNLPPAPWDSMTPADWAFDQWIEKVSKRGSAFEDLND
jgi:hypothetical protein